MKWLLVGFVGALWLYCVIYLLVYAPVKKLPTVEECSGDEELFI